MAVEKRSVIISWIDLVVNNFKSAIGATKIDFPDFQVSGASVFQKPAQNLLLQ